MSAGVEPRSRALALAGLVIGGGAFSCGGMGLLGSRYASPEDDVRLILAVAAASALAGGLLFTGSALLLRGRPQGRVVLRVWVLLRIALATFSVPALLGPDGPAGPLLIWEVGMVVYAMVWLGALRA